MRIPFLFLHCRVHQFDACKAYAIALHHSVVLQLNIAGLAWTTAGKLFPCILAVDKCGSVCIVLDVYSARAAHSPSDA